MVKVPRGDELWEFGQELIEQHGGRNVLWDRLEKLYFQEGDVGEEEEAVQRVVLPLATNVVDLVVDLASAQELRVEVPASGESQKEKVRADTVEKWLRAWFSLNEKVQRRGSLRAQMAWLAAMRGMVVVRVLPLVGERGEGETGEGERGEEKRGRLPVVVQVRDPRRVYVDWGPLGPRAVVEEYERSVASIWREYPDALGGREGKEFAGSDMVLWREYWDERWCAYWADGEPVRVAGRHVRPHMYGVLPYGVAYARSTPVRDPARGARPLLASVERVIENVQVLASIMATAGVQSVASAFALYSRRYGGEGRPELDLSPGAVNYFDPTAGEKVEPIQRAPLPPDLFQLLNLFLTQFQQGTFPVALFGEVGRGMAGYAINLLTQSGRRALLPIWRAIEEGHELAAMECVALARNLVGPALGKPLPLVDVESEGGRVVRQRELELDWEALGEDFDVHCQLGDPMPADRAANLRMALEAWRAGFLSHETALSDYGIVPDAQEEMLRVFVEQVVAKNIEAEALRVAVERGYLPEEALHEMVAKVAGGAGRAQGAGRAPGNEPVSGAVDQALMQQVAGLPEVMPTLEQMAGEGPTVPPPVM